MLCFHTPVQSNQIYGKGKIIQYVPKIIIILETVKNKHNDFGSVFLNFLPLFTITQSGDIIDKQISGLWYSYENLL